MVARALYADIIADAFGNRLPGASVQVRDAGTSNPYSGGSLFAAPAGAATLANPLTADPRGYLYFYTASPATLDLYVSAPGYNALTVAGVPSAAPAASIDGAALVAGSVDGAAIATG